ncbi:MAG: class II fructose-bisphosphate aldolase [Candidatus Diapherotrites archaeon]|nr:class II fructose-bisphosphate aldolase [Candidatus Diapherotrites archaeon]
MIDGKELFGAVRDKGCIVMAANTRMTLVTEGIFRAAKDADSVVMVELAKSESNLSGGYTGLTPAELAKRSKEAAEAVGFDAWSLHADHLTVKKGTPEEIADTKKLIKAQIDAGFNSFAIDASFLFDESGAAPAEQLARNVEVTTELVNYIKDNYNGDSFGLEVEVGEIGKKSDAGLVVTTPEEATAFISALNKNDIFPDALAIANGSTHGNIYDSEGRLMEQVSIDIPQTVAVAKALAAMGSGTRIAQHGITGTPRELIYEKFPHGDIIKGNVGTFWQNVCFDAFEELEPELYKKIRDWTLENYREKMPGKGDEEVFGKMGKKAVKEFFGEIYAVGDEARERIDSVSYKEALGFFKAFRSEGSASFLK